MDLNLHKKLVVPSQLSATKIADLHYKIKEEKLNLIDYNGQHWQIEEKITQFPSSTKKGNLVWQSQISIYLDASIEDLVEKDVLDAVLDARKISLLSGNEIPFKLRPMTFTGDSEEECVKRSYEYLEKIKNNLLLQNITQIKINIINRYLDELNIFK